MKALTVENILQRRYRTLDLTGEWLEAFGRPAPTGVWFVWGNSGNGKTSFVLQLIKELSRSERVFFNSLEEGDGLTLREGLERCGFTRHDRRVLVGVEDREALEKRLKQWKSPNVVVIDSFQAFGLNYREYLELKKAMRSKLLIFVSQASANLPKGSAATSVMYDADMKIWVEGFRAFSKGRTFGTGDYYTVWGERAAKYWGKTGEGQDPDGDLDFDE
jgi:hypothetical protein